MGRNADECWRGDDLSDDCAKLRDLGVKEILLQDTPPDAIVAMVRRVVAERGPR